jgi:hypothetical protein
MGVFISQACCSIADKPSVWRAFQQRMVPCWTAMYKCQAKNLIRSGSNSSNAAEMPLYPRIVHRPRPFFQPTGPYTIDKEPTTSNLGEPYSLGSPFDSANSQRALNYKQTGSRLAMKWLNSFPTAPASSHPWRGSTNFPFSQTNKKHIMNGFPKEIQEKTANMVVEILVPVHREPSVYLAVLIHGTISLDSRRKSNVDYERDDSRSLYFRHKIFAQSPLFCR